MSLESTVWRRPHIGWNAAAAKSEVPRGLKPRFYAPRTARLKPCPFKTSAVMNHAGETLGFLLLSRREGLGHSECAAPTLPPNEGGKGGAPGGDEEGADVLRGVGHREKPGLKPEFLRGSFHHAKAWCFHPGFCDMAFVGWKRWPSEPAEGPAAKLLFECGFSRGLRLRLSNEGRVPIGDAVHRERPGRQTEPVEAPRFSVVNRSLWLLWL